MNKENLANGVAVSLTGNSLVLQSGQGAIFPTAPFYITVSPPGVVSNSLNSEIMEVDGVTGDTLNVARAQRGTTEKAVTTGWFVGNGVYVEDVDAKADSTDLTAHVTDTSNPHSVTKAQVGLGSVPNTDFTTPVSAATAHAANTSNPHGVTKAQVGLGNVNNTSDASKPVSTATQSALNTKLDDTQLDTDATLAANSDTKVASQKATKAYVDKLTGYKDLVSKIESPTYISHRGGRHLYPEESMDGFRASMESGFLPEMDIQYLSDGTLVLLHDSTVDRTMTGVTGNASSITPAQWKKARIKPAIKGGKEAFPVFFEDLLDELGGKVVLVPEIKPTTVSAGYTQAVIDAIKNRGLERCIIVQSFDYQACKDVAAAGIEALYLFSTMPSQSPSQIKSDGINYVGPKYSISSSNITSLKNAGLSVWPYTVNTKAEADSLISNGADGVFSDDPWIVSGNFAAEKTPNFLTGYGKPGLRSTMNELGNYTETDFDNLSIAANGLVLSNGRAPSSASTQNIVYIPSVGKIKIPFGIGMTVDFLGSGGGPTTTAGFGLYNNSSNQDAPYYDNSYTGQNGFFAALRKSGQVTIWKYVDGASASKIVETTAPTGASQTSPAGATGSARFYVEAYYSAPGTVKISLANQDKNLLARYNETFDPGEMNFFIRKGLSDDSSERTVIRDIVIYEPDGDSA